ncbi:hypothetical protein OU995_21265 [Roseateles sp. SL47]|uniref:hypothetical protein n=1 Tax=Roseateles sp. SL47 TaxID=2995138 RepID=UPI0022704D83|nr:hypothetical protein [Roseateles sp. SL47]WAC72076.1 hypothetical protein OU995_21265 [Roseateles sp. SL47]
MSGDAGVVEDGPPVNRDNYMHMSGEPLRKYAHTMGISRSEADRYDDDKLKTQIRIAISHRYEDDQ